MPDMAESTARKRSSNVCQACHSRKVRCDLEMKASPCTNCRERELICKLYKRKAYSTAKRARRNVDKATPTSEVTSAPCPPLAHQIKVIEAIVLKPSSKKTTIYAGKTGYGTLLDIMSSGTASTSRRVQIHGPLPANLAHDDLGYLQGKGCFELPSQSSELVEAYLSFVHPTFPVLDGEWLSNSLATGGINTISLLLVWSIFSVSSAYMSEHAASSVRSSFFAKGKLLFHLAGEDDKIILIQSALLLSFWYDDGEEPKQSWYWSGIAFSLAQALGLDQENEDDGGGMVPGMKRETMGNLWKCCLIRDAWLSYSMGRSLRLYGKPHRERHTSKAATASHLKGLRVDTRSIDFGTGEGVLEKAWKMLVDTAEMLRSALTSSAPPDRAVSRRLDRICEELASSIDGSASTAVVLGIRHAQLSLHAATIAIYYLHSAVDQQNALRSATSSINVLGSCLARKECALVPPSIVTLIMPALLVFAAQSNSGSEDTKQDALRNMETSFHYLDQLQSTYPAASIVRRLFSSVIANGEEMVTS